MRAVQSAHLTGHRSMNPCPVHDRHTDTLFLFFIAVEGRVSESHQLTTGRNAARLCCVRSADRGRSWGAPTDLTDPTIGRRLGQWATFALGPGHGVQLRGGRLVVGAYAYRIDRSEGLGGVGRSRPHSFGFYSDDHGRTWRVGEAVPNLRTGECQMVSVEEANGSRVLYCNARSPLGCRVQALSPDGGAAFLSGRLVRRLAEPARGCHGSVVGFPAPTGSRGPPSPTPPPPHPPPTWVAFSHPTSPASRADLGVYLSTCPRDPDSWTEPWVISEGPSAYSDLAYLEAPSGEAGAPAAAIGCLYECGDRAAHERIAFSLFTVRELLRNVSDAAQRSPSPPSPSRSAKGERSCCGVA